LRAKGREIFRIKFGSEKPETLRLIIPRWLYADSTTFEFSLRKLTGKYTVLAGLKLYPFLIRKGNRQGALGEQVAGLLETKLFPGQPNPFSKVSFIRFQIAQPDNVKLRVYDISGRVVRRLVQGERKPGSYIIRWDGTDDHGHKLANGVYILRLETTGLNQTQKVVLGK